MVRTTQELEMSRNCKQIEIMPLVIMFQQAVVELLWMHWKFV